MNNNAERELGWDDPIENDSPDFVLLPEGDYDFEVVSFERARHAGSEKLPPCNKAIVHIKIEGEEGISIIRHNLFLHTITEGMLCRSLAFDWAIIESETISRLIINKTFFLSMMNSLPNNMQLTLICGFCAGIYLDKF